MKRRLNIACGVLHDPEILLLDEPTVGVDPQSRQRIWEMLQALHNREVSMLLTTHQLEEAQQLCKRIVIIDHGRVIADGTFEELVQETVGPERQVTLHLEGTVPDALQQTDFGITGESTLQCKVDNVAEELPGLLARLSTAGARVRELSIESPTLQEVFIHLTGRELRE
jgi:ABC-2 type transport system ATP-binding protein